MTRIAAPAQGLKETATFRSASAPPGQDPCAASLTGTGEDGTEFRLDEPEQLLWVHCAEVDSYVYDDAACMTRRVRRRPQRGDQRN
jgi:hypothetical protein